MILRRVPINLLNSRLLRIMVSKQILHKRLIENLRVEP